MKGLERTKTDQYSRTPIVSDEQRGALPHGIEKVKYATVVVAQEFHRISVGFIRQVVCNVREVGVETGQFIEESKQSRCVVHKIDL